MDRNLIDYLPPYMQNYKQLVKILETEQQEVETSWQESEVVINNLFLDTMGELGVELYENMLGIVKNPTYSLEERLFNIKSKLNGQLPYTLSKLREILSALCGFDDRYEIELDYNEYKIEVKLALESKNNVSTVEERLYDILPCNLIYEVSLLYNQHSLIANYTHSQLAEYTHNQIRSEVME